MDMNARLTRIDNLPPNPDYPTIPAFTFQELCSDLGVDLPIDQVLGGIGTPVVLRVSVGGEAVGLFACVPDF
jgi:hypothetical protein